MNIKKIFTATAVIASLAVSVAAQAATPYVEGQLGFANLDNVDTNSYSGTSGSVTVTGLRANLDYDSSATYGAEFGFKDVIDPGLRIAVSISTMKFDLNSAQINGVITNGSTTYTGPVTVTAANLASVGANFDNRVNLYMLNAYYDFKTSTDFTPFVGFGIGLADIKNAKDTEFAYSVNAGAKYNIDKNVYVGAKGAYTRVNGPTDQLGIKFQDIAVYSANVSIGYEF